VRRLREHLREIRRVAGETQRQVTALQGRLAAIEAALDELKGTGSAQHSQVLEALRFIHSRGQAQRERLRELRNEPEYGRPYTDPQPLVSVVIPTYDNYELLRERTLPSVLAQTYENFEVVVVGDAAPEAAHLAVESLGDPRIRFSNLPYRGPYPEDPAARWRVAGGPPYNEAVRLARGLWIAPLGDDDAFRPNHLEQVLAYARREQLELAYARLCMHEQDPDKTVSIGRFPPEQAQFGLQSAIYHHGLASLFELELVDAWFGLPNDWGICLRMMEAGVRMGMLDEETVDYYPSEVWTPRSEG
jgi:hypothetical protein